LELLEFFAAIRFRIDDTETTKRQNQYGEKEKQNKSVIRKEGNFSHSPAFAFLLRHRPPRILPPSVLSLHRLPLHIPAYLAPTSPTTAYPAVAASPVTVN
jgi:hypothetical protein